MRFENIELFKEENTYFKAYICDDMPWGFSNRRKTILICPGGGYSCVCDDREGDAIARAFLAKGYNAFVLKYSVKPYASDYRPLLQVATAIRHIRENAEQYKVDPNSIFVIGFSAGGHLACSSGVFWNHPKVKEAMADAPEGINRPNGMILCYPVISSGKFSHVATFENLCRAGEISEEAKAEFSLENFVDSTTPPAFIWHTVGDTIVPVENSLLMAGALRENGVPFELHIYPDGDHGISLGTAELYDGRTNENLRHVGSWFELAIEWAESIKTSTEFSKNK